MKENELMIGDWVIDGTQPAQVTGITCGGVIETTANKHSNIEVIEPISIIHEILERNGWEWHDDNAKFFPETWVGSLLLRKEEEGFRLLVISDYDDEDTNDTPFTIRYVHELQHALRMGGIEKEIKL